MRTSGRADEGQKHALTAEEDDADSWGSTHEAEGLLTPIQRAGARCVHVAGRAPQGGLPKSLDHVGSRRAVAGTAWLDVLDADGATMGSCFVNEGAVVAVQVKACKAGLDDLTVTLGRDQALPGPAAGWDLIRTGCLKRTGMWKVLDPEDRRAGLSVALSSRPYQRRGKPDRLPDEVRHHRKVMGAALTAAGMGNYAAEWLWSYRDRYWARSPAAAVYGPVERGRAA